MKPAITAIVVLLLIWLTVAYIIISNPSSRRVSHRDRRRRDRRTANIQTIIVDAENHLLCGMDWTTPAGSIVAAAHLHDWIKTTTRRNPGTTHHTTTCPECLHDELRETLTPKTPGPVPEKTPDENPENVPGKTREPDAEKTPGPNSENTSPGKRPPVFPENRQPGYLGKSWRHTTPAYTSMFSWENSGPVSATKPSQETTQDETEHDPAVSVWQEIINEHTKWQRINQPKTQDSRSEKPSEESLLQVFQKSRTEHRPCPRATMGREHAPHLWHVSPAVTNNPNTARWCDGNPVKQSQRTGTMHCGLRTEHPTHRITVGEHQGWCGGIERPPPTVSCPLCPASSQDLPAHFADYHPARKPGTVLPDPTCSRTDPHGPHRLRGQTRDGNDVVWCHGTWPEPGNPTDEVHAVKAPCMRAWEQAHVPHEWWSNYANTSSRYWCDGKARGGARR